MQKITKKEKGFSLVEVLVAGAVIMVAATAAMFVASQSFSGSGLSKDRVVAFYLGQEAMEWVRHVRDTNKVKNQSWLTDITTCMNGTTCYVDVYDSGSGLRACSGTCPAVRKETSTGRFGHASGWSDTKFTRSVSVEQVASEEIRITVTVSWGPGNHSITLTSNLLNWL